MKIKIFALLLAGTVLISACGGLPSLGIGGTDQSRRLGIYLFSR